jgi:hypothetical protein
MFRHVALVRTDVSEEPGASFIKVTRIGKLGTTLAVTSNRRTPCNIPEDANLHSHGRENLKSNKTQNAFGPVAVRTESHIAASSRQDVSTEGHLEAGVPGM